MTVELFEGYGQELGQGVPGKTPASFFGFDNHADVRLLHVRRFHKVDEANFGGFMDLLG